MFRVKKSAPLSPSQLMEFAGRALTIRAQSTAELRTRLLRKATRPEDVEEVIAKLKELGYLDDSKFASAYSDWRRDNEGFGKTRVLRDLLSRKVSADVAKKALDTSYSATDEVAMIEAFLARKYRGKDLPALLKEEKNLASAYRKLRTAGFGTSNSIRVLKRYSAQAEALEDPDDPSGAG